MRASLAVTVVIRDAGKLHVSWSVARNGELAKDEREERGMLYSALWQAANEIAKAPMVAPIQLEGGGDKPLPVEELTRPMRNKRHAANARIALSAYRTTGGQDENDLVAIGDLIGDLCHLYDEMTDEGHISPEEMVNNAVSHFQAERDEAIAFPTTIG